MTTPVVLTLSQSKKRLVYAKFRPRNRHRGRLTMRIHCQKEKDRASVPDQSIQKCKGCRNKVKLVEEGVFCSYGVKKPEPLILMETLK